MFKIQSYSVSDNFFAARNSHDGFKSLFTSVFSPKKYVKIFILKGGPGTGKSTLLRGIISFANETMIDAKAILCSSDINSLDGVILTQNNHSIAIIDGTAPHTVDPIYPGAVEEIINLGDGFNIKALEERRQEIFYHSHEKKVAYQKAYSVLLSSKSIFDCIWNELKNSALYNEAEDIAKQIFNVDKTNNLNEKNDVKLYSSFGKNGQYSLSPNHGYNPLNLVGNEFLCSMILDAVSKSCVNNKIPQNRYSSALDDRMAERLLFGETVIVYNQNLPETTVIGQYDMGKYCREFERIYNNYTSLLKIAQLYFGEASSSHFALEKIYSEAVDFSFNDRIYTNLCDRIYNILL